MWEKFTPSSRRIIRYAHEEAKHFRSISVDTEHILLGLLRDKNSTAVNVLNAMEVCIEGIRNSLTRQIEFMSEDAESVNFSRDAKDVLETSFKEARRLKKSSIGSEHLFLGLLQIQTGKAFKVLTKHDITYQDAIEYIGHSNRMYPQGRSKACTPNEHGMTIQEATEHLDHSCSELPQIQSLTPTLVEIATDLTKLVKDGKRGPCIGREIEIRRVLQILSKRTRNNTILIGDPGVGKTTIVEGLAQRIIDNLVPGILRHGRVVSLDLAGLTVGTNSRAEFDTRLTRMMEEITSMNGPIILFINEMHKVLGEGAAESMINASVILKPAFSSRKLRCIGATTANEYKKCIERNDSMERWFQLVNIDEPTPDETVVILNGLRKKYEDYHEVIFTDEAIKAAAYLSQRFISDRSLPDKAIDLIDEAASNVRLSSFEEEELEKAVGISPEVTAESDEDSGTGKFEEIQEGLHPPDVLEKDIVDVIHAWTGIPVSVIAGEETQPQPD